MDDTAIDADDYVPPKVTGKIKSDVPPSRPSAGPPKAFRPPKVEDLSTWEYLQEVWDFEKKDCKVPFGGTPQPSSNVESALDHMHEMGDNYGEWLETQLQRWETAAAELRKANPDWRKKCHKTVADVLPSEYHPDVHAAMLDASGADSGIVKRAPGLHHGRGRPAHRFL